MKDARSFENLFAEARGTVDFKKEATILEFVTSLHRRMEREGVSRAELAQRLGTSAAYVTKVLRGDVNFTVETMVKLADALRGKLHLHVADGECSVRWMEVFDTPRHAKRSAERAVRSITDYSTVFESEIGGSGARCTVAA